MVTKNNDELILEESLVESDEFVTKTMMKPDSFYESLESFSSDLQIFNVAGQKEEQNKSDAEENMSFSVGNKIEHMVGEHTLKADRIWEPGGCLVKTDRQMLQTEAVLHGQVQFSGPEKLKNDKLQSCIGLNLCEFRVDHGVDILFSHQMHRVKEIYVLPKKILSQACPYQKAHLVWEQGGSVGKQAPWNCLDKRNPDLDGELKDELQESRRVWERGRLTAMCALAIVTPPFDISFDNTVIQEMRKSCVLIVVGSATMRMMRWLHMIELVGSMMIKLDVKILSRPFGDMDARFQEEIVTTALGIGVSLECLEPYLSHDEVLGLTTKTHLAKETREWSNQSTLKIQVCTDFNLAALIEFESYDWKCKEQMIILVDHSPRRYELGGDDRHEIISAIAMRSSEGFVKSIIVTEHDQWKEVEKGYACSRLTSLVQEMVFEVKVMYMIEKNKTVIVTDSHALVLAQKWLLHLLHIQECRGFSLLTVMHLSQEEEEFHYSRGMEHDSSSCVTRQDRSCVILLMNSSVSVLSKRDSLVSEKKMTEISTEVCYDSRYGSYSNIGVSAATFQGELNSVCRLLLGVFLTQQRRDCGFFGVLRQWKWYPPEQFYKALSNRSVLLWTWLKTAKFFPWLVVDIAKKKLKDTCNVFCKALRASSRPSYMGVSYIFCPMDEA
ncbi:hypothetical protein F2Q70_00026622 [Brassica cretica]|uniref:Uncharacterized protein n=1 Tax=Brassica cretica TaxID=69181 RepID=A0A8S9LA95_BRACR|nr:hypothetical protein F2Q70_00026622 [Brassica cretica]